MPQRLYQNEVIKIQVLNKNPHIVLKKSFLSNKDIQTLLEVNEFSKSKGVVIDSNSQRNSKTYREKNNEFISIKKKIFNFLKTLDFNYSFNNYEEIRIMKYEEGQQFTRHYDFFNQDPKEKLRYNDRVATVLIYLKEPEEGGATKFNDLNIKVKGKVGDLLFYRYDNDLKFQTSHTGEKVLKGNKIILGLCIREKEFNN